MGAVNFPKGSKEWALFVDFWNICKKYWIVEDNESYWDNLIKDTHEFIKKYEEFPFAQKIGIAFIDCQDDEQKKKENNK